LHFSDARLDAQTLGALIEGDIPPSVFFQSLASTAIERSTGTAKDASLRTIEVAIPMELFFEITLFEAGQSFSSKEHSSYLSLLCGSIKSMGHKKTRGFGRCTIALIQKPS
jgi:CRISPR/Cas system CSM-associated protein Csm3 (group 7 of RAMP superfamily)